jgi:hypothetical protein
MDRLICSNIEVLDQLEMVLSQLGGSNFKKQLKVLNNSTIGQHVRHILEFYQCLICAKKSGTVNYDGRLRNLQIEADLSYTFGIIKEIKTEIPQIDKLQNIILFADDMTIPSTCYRELYYLLEHTVHHLAIINIAISSDFATVKVPQHFGVAYSTIKHQQHQSA